MKGYWPIKDPKECTKIEMYIQEHNTWIEAAVHRKVFEQFFELFSPFIVGTYDPKSSVYIPFPSSDLWNPTPLLIKAIVNPLAFALVLSVYSCFDPMNFDDVLFAAAKKSLLSLQLALFVRWKIHPEDLLSSLIENNISCAPGVISWLNEFKGMEYRDVRLAFEQMVGPFEYVMRTDKYWVDHPEL